MIADVLMEKRIQHLKRSKAAEIFGWVSSVALLASYALLTLDIVKSNSLVYNSLCFIGGLGLAIVTFRHRAYQSFMVNTIFTVIAVIAILHILLV